jgi:hypothetical protein
VTLRGQFPAAPQGVLGVPYCHLTGAASSTDGSRPSGSAEWEDADGDLYLGGPGTVIRCRHCTGVLIVITQIRGMHCVDLMGMKALDTEGTIA